MKIDLKTPCDDTYFKLIIQKIFMALKIYLTLTMFQLKS